ncbi:hypothetical protein KMZ30_06925 [Phycicoccus sp. KQZ13P-1]|uniref:hypothetical protein n=1 Tax=Phycicoccus mangrovi TaxID=2840470 RepID=UPI001C00140E|nr:hypothetical protein [Phycicoccus mangrovi]MBT9255308.1 hypothetical protein [Phycicoccus mangrovi]
MNGRAHGAAFDLLLREAVVGVPSEYFSLPYLDKQRASTTAHQERVYCYELYHQMRLVMAESKHDAIAAAVEDGWRVNGEVAKGLSYISGRQIPDFIWHKPGSLENGHVLEVKSAAARWAPLHSDVKKLQEFKAQAGYAHATLLTFGPIPTESAALSSLRALAVGAGVGILFHRGVGDGLSY